jgi:hypothetical protein
MHAPEQHPIYLDPYNFGVFENEKELAFQEKVRRHHIRGWKTETIMSKFDLSKQELKEIIPNAFN